MIALARRFRAFGSDLLLIPTMWRYLVRAARIDQQIAARLASPTDRVSAGDGEHWILGFIRDVEHSLTTKEG